MAQVKHHVACMPSPGMGHLIPHVELAKQLVLRHDISVTFLVPTIGPPSKAITSVLQGLPEHINHVLLPPVNFEEDVKAEIQIVLAIKRSLSSVRDVFKSLVASTHLMALVVDPFGTDAFDVAREFYVPSYVYFLTNALSLSLLHYMPKLDEVISCEVRDMEQPLKLPGFTIPIHGRDFPDPLQDRKNDAYRFMIQIRKRYSLADGILINTFMELEPGVIKALQEEPSMRSIYPIGPIIRTVSDGELVDGSESHQCMCIRWLDNQASGSVLFVSFGSGGTLSYDQLEELALGLELSEQQFLWVVKSPDDKSASGSFFDVHSKTDPFGFLPTGFLDRTKEQGLVVPSWAPQVEVLGHPSTGGFLTHCGWNSTLESIVHGVPLIAWPLYAEQRLNAVLLSEDLNVALRPPENENGLIRREEIAKVIKGLMHGEEGVIIRDRMNRLKDAAAAAVSDGGSSTKTLSQLVHKWKKQN